MLIKNNKKAFKNNLSYIKLNISMLKDDKVVKLPNKPIYKKIYIELLNLYKKKPAKEEPIILTKAVEIGSPTKEKLKSVNKYLKLEPITAPITSAMYEFINLSILRIE